MNARLISTSIFITAAIIAYVVIPGTPATRSGLDQASTPVIATSSSSDFDPRVPDAAVSAPAEVPQTHSELSRPQTTPALAATSSEKGTNAQEISDPRSVTLAVGEARYVGLVPKNATVLDAMRVFEKDGLAFTGKDFPGIGFFIETINGSKPPKGQYWILYLNGKTSVAGASQTSLKPGDSIEWKQEKSW